MQRSLALNKGQADTYAAVVTQGRISSQVPELISDAAGGRVHSCFRSSLNLEICGHLIHIGTDRPGLCCFGLSVSEYEMALILDGLQTDDRVVCRPDCIRIYGSRRIVTLNREQFTIVDLRIPVREGGSIPGAGLLYRELEARVGTWLREGRLGLEPDASFVYYSKLLSDRIDPEKAVAYFLGRGKGLTPGGDDILTGYGAILQMTGTAGPLVHAVCSRLTGTTDVSRAYLESMEKGYANEVFVQLLNQLFRENLLDIRKLLCKMEEMGHTSGCDTLYGVYLALKKFKEDTIV